MLKQAVSQLISISQFTLFILCMIVSKQSLSNEYEIKLVRLGDYQLKYQTALSAVNFKGQTVLAKTKSDLGSNYNVTMPFAIQRIEFRVAHGAKVKRDQIIAQLHGFEVEHFIDEYQAAKAIFETAQQHFTASKEPFRSRTIQNPEWLQVSKNYYQAKLNFEHFSHYKSLLEIRGDHDVFIKSPITGVLNKNKQLMNIQAEQRLFDVIAKQDLYLVALLPTSNLKHLSHFIEINTECRYQVARQENVFEDYLVPVWLSSKSNDCQPELGGSTSLVPFYHFDGVEVAKSSIFEIDQTTYVAIKQDNLLKIIAVDLIASTNTSFYVQSEFSLTGHQVLVSSVSAVQGILLGMGEE